MVGAMDPEFKESPYKGTPEKSEIPGFCGSCHSDPSYMKQFRPEIRVDQEQEYWTSRHGKALREGDSKVATCVDCHHSHGILPASDVDSPVYPRRIAETCSSCHSNHEYMAGYTKPDGSPLPIDQYALWNVSVHGEALLRKEDLSAPTCNDCHGNHGATPPGLESISYVCGQCHNREASLFRASGKHKGFQRHNEFLQAMGPGNCETCHEMPESLSLFPTFHSLSECATCHGSHGVVRPTLAMFSPLPATPCAFCHEASNSVAEELPGQLSADLILYEEMRDGLLETAEEAQLEDHELFDWLVDASLALPNHTRSSQDGDEAELRPEFDRLFTKFRIGKTYFSFKEPASGDEARRAVVRCSHCHAEVGGESRATSAEVLKQMQQLTSTTAQAERLLLKGRRGGVETRKTLEAIDHAVDTQIELEVLVHEFSTGEGSAFRLKQQEGLEFSRAALMAGSEALEELGVRRRGLLVSLGFICLLLLALGIKIRSTSAKEVDEQ